MDGHCYTAHSSLCIVLLSPPSLSTKPSQTERGMHARGEKLNPTSTGNAIFWLLSLVVKLSVVVNGWPLAPHQPFCLKFVHAKNSYPQIMEGLLWARDVSNLAHILNLCFIHLIPLHQPSLPSMHCYCCIPFKQSAQNFRSL